MALLIKLFVNIKYKMSSSSKVEVVYIKSESQIVSNIWLVATNMAAKLLILIDQWSS